MWKIFIIAATCTQLVYGQCDTPGCGATRSTPGSSNRQQEFSSTPEYTKTENGIPSKATARTIPFPNINRNFPEYTNNPVFINPKTNVRQSTVETFRENYPEFTDNRGTIRPEIILRSTPDQRNNENFPDYTDGQTTVAPEKNVRTGPPRNSQKSDSRIYFPDQDYNLTIPSETLDTKLFQQMSVASENRNLCFSPLSAQLLLTLLFTLSEGKLQDELSRLLDLPSSNRKQVALKYKKLTQVPESTDMKNILILANKLYFNQRYGSLKQNIRSYALGTFATEVEPTDFNEIFKAAHTINSWVSEKTQQLINNVVTPQSLDSATSALLISSLYFKSEWQNKFSTYETEKEPFFITSKRQVLVDTMYTEDAFRYGEFEQLRATVVEMPYKLDNFSMMIILPNDIDGLAAVQERLSDITIKLISRRLEEHEVTIKLPKFKIEFEVDMVETLKRLGLQSLFNADSRVNIFEDQELPLVVDQIKQKTYINVNEIGTEAAAATFSKIVPLSISIRMKRFTANHPFIYVIRNPEAVYFMGHVKYF